jgi:hypothetical protein
MTISNSRGSYKDCFDVYNAALEDPEGVRIKVKDYSQAVFFRMRMHKARSIVREESKDIYSPGDPGYSVTVYDPLVVRIRAADGDAWYVYVEQQGLNLGEIEPLSKIEEEEDRVLPPPTRQLMIEAQPTEVKIERVQRRL